MLPFLKSRLSPGAIVVALNLVLTFNSTLARLIMSWAALETSIGAISRVEYFVRKTPSEGRMRGPD